MQQIFVSNNRTISDIYGMYGAEDLVIDESYQRRSVWGEKDKIRLIETILLNLVIPELFFWPAETNPDTGKSKTHIVDGQQRIKAIASFIRNEFKLKPQYLLDEANKGDFSNKYFRDFPDDAKKQFWNYKLMVVEFNPNTSRDQVIKIFRRLNLTNYNLNDQEKRNSMSGDFATLAKTISELEIWEKYSLFNVADVRRMKDVEFSATLIVLYKKGIVDQTDQSILNQVYEDYQENYNEADEDEEAIVKATILLEELMCSENIKSFLQRKAQLYTIFCIIFYMGRQGIVVDDALKHRLDEFVILYSKFKNDLDLDGQLDEYEKQVFDVLKKYKLASSEGLNKHTNRMIRKNAMADFLFNFNDAQLAAVKTLLGKMEEATKAMAKVESEIEIEEDDTLYNSVL